MKAMFVNDDDLPYTRLIVIGQKVIETRTKNTLLPLVGERVAIVRTHSGSKPTVVGYATVQEYYFCPVIMLNSFRDLTLVPKGSTYDKLGKRNGKQGKWFYELKDAEPCEPYPLPSSAIRHGRSWCEF